VEEFHEVLVEFSMCAFKLIDTYFVYLAYLVFFSELMLEAIFL
jgi:hypothetical protein